MEGGGSNGAQLKRCCVICDKAEATSKEKLKCLNSSKLDNYRSQLISHPIGEPRPSSFEPERELLICRSCEERLNSVIVGKGILKSMTEEAVEMEKSYARKLEQLKFTGKCVLSNLSEIVSLREQQQEETSGLNNVKLSKLYFGEVIKNASDEIAGFLTVLERKKTALNECFTTTSQATSSVSSLNVPPPKTSNTQQQRKSNKEDRNVIAASEPTSSQPVNEPVITSLTSLPSDENEIEIGPVFLRPKVEEPIIEIESEDGSEADEEKGDEGGAVFPVVDPDEPQIEEVAKVEFPPLEQDEDLDLSNDARIDYSKLRFTEDGIQILEGTRSRPKRYGPLYKNPTGGLKIHAKNKSSIGTSSSASTSHPSNSISVPKKTQKRQRAVKGVSKECVNPPEDSEAERPPKKSRKTKSVPFQLPMEDKNDSFKSLSGNGEEAVNNTQQQALSTSVSSNRNEDQISGDDPKGTNPDEQINKSSQAKDRDPDSIQTVICGSYFATESEEDRRLRCKDSLYLYQKHSERKDGNEFCFEHFLESYEQNQFNLKTQPAGGYALVGWNFDSEYVNEKLMPLWKRFGPSVKVLDVLRCSTTKVISQNFYNAIFDFTPNLMRLDLEGNSFAKPSPQLKQKEINSLSENAQQLASSFATKSKLEYFVVIDQLPPFFDRFSELFTNVQTLMAYFEKAATVYPIEKMFAHNSAPWLSIKTIDVQKAKARIRTADVSQSKCSLHFLCLSSFPALEDLSIHLGPGTGNNGWDDEFNKSLESFSGSLVTLDVYREVTQFPKNAFSIGNTKMEKLEELWLGGSVTDSLDFLEVMPKLRKLEIYLKCTGITFTYESVKEEYVWKKLEWKMTRNNNNDMPTMIQLNYLRYFDIDFHLSSEDLKLLKKWAPHLNNIGCIADNSTFGVLCCLWKLEELQLYKESTVGDEGIIPNLPVLKSCLKRLSFQCLRVEGLTDRSVHEGFLLIENLEHLCLPTSHNISEAAEDLLRAKIPDGELYEPDF